MKQTLQIVNCIAFLVMIVVNYLANTRQLASNTIGEVSKDLNTLFTPAGYAFSIWGLIYLLLLGFIVFQGKSLFNGKSDNGFILKIGWWFVISCVANCLWLFCWVNGYTAWSVVCIMLLLVSLLVVIVKNNMEMWDAPLQILAFLWWPFVIYAGWITVATIANVAAFLQKIAWDGWGLSETTWTVLMISIATIISLLVTWIRYMREFALVGVWALIAIAVANWNTNDTVTTTALIAAGILFSSSAIQALRYWKMSPIRTILIKYIK